MVDLDPANGWLTSGRLVVIDLRTLQVTLDRTDAMPFNPSELGMAQGYDQVECSFNEVITAGEMAFQNGGMGNQEDGYVQLLRLD
jgi:hypothetical protein